MAQIFDPNGDLTRKALDTASIIPEATLNRAARNQALDQASIIPNVGLDNIARLREESAEQAAGPLNEKRLTPEERKRNTLANIESITRRDVVDPILTSTDIRPRSNFQVMGPGVGGIPTVAAGAMLFPAGISSKIRNAHSQAEKERNQRIQENSAINNIDPNLSSPFMQDKFNEQYTSAMDEQILRAQEQIRNNPQWGLDESQFGVVLNNSQEFKDFQREMQNLAGTYETVWKEASRLAQVDRGELKSDEYISPETRMAYEAILAGEAMPNLEDGTLGGSRDFMEAFQTSRGMDRVIGDAVKLIPKNRLDALKRYTEGTDYTTSDVESLQGHFVRIGNDGIAKFDEEAANNWVQSIYDEQYKDAINKPGYEDFKNRALNALGLSEAIVAKLQNKSKVSRSGSGWASKTQGRKFDSRPGDFILNNEQYTTPQVIGFDSKDFPSKGVEWRGEQIKPEAVLFMYRISQPLDPQWVNASNNEDLRDFGYGDVLPKGMTPEMIWQAGGDVEVVPVMRHTILNKRTSEDPTTGEEREVQMENANLNQFRLKQNSPNQDTSYWFDEYYPYAAMFTAQERLGTPFHDFVVGVHSGEVNKLDLARKKFVNKNGDFRFTSPTPAPQTPKTNTGGYY